MAANFNLQVTTKTYYAKLGSDGFFTELNEPLRKKLSFTQSLSVPVKATSIIDTYYHTAFVNAIARCRENDSKKTGVLLRMGNPHGQGFFVDWQFSSSYGANGELNNITCVGQEAPAKLHNALSMEMQFEILKMMSDSASESILLLSPDFKILSYNHSANTLSLQLYNKQYNAGDDFRSYVKPEAQGYFYSQFAKALAGCASEEYFELPGDNDRTLYLKVQMRPVKSTIQKGVTCVAIITRDVTPLRELDLRLSEVTAMQSHQIRRPVANMLSLVDLLDNGNMDVEQKQYLQLLKLSIAQLDDEIRNIVKKARNK